MLKTPLFPFQAEDVRHLNVLDGRALIANEVGLGKSLTALYYAWRFLPEDPSGPIVVVCPAHLKIHWSREARKHLEQRVEILEGERCPEGKLPPHNPNQTFVINYDVLTPPHWKPNTVPPADSWLRYLESLNPRILILDEGQYLRNYSSARTRAIRHFSKRVARVLVLTGTPLANKPQDLWPICNIVDPSLFPSRQDFLTEFTHMRLAWWGWDSKGAKNLDRMHKILTDTIMIRRRKCDVLDQLPAVTYTTLPMEIDLAEYRKAENDYIGWLFEQSPAKATSASRAEEIARLGGLKKLAGVLKAPAIAAWTKELLEETEGKILLGAHHHDVTGVLMKAFKKRAVLVNGAMDHHEKQAAFDRFNNNPNCDKMVANLQAGGTGWSCTSTSDVAICELPWVPSDIEQFCGRVIGIGRGLPGVPVHIRFLIAEETIDEDLCTVLEKKRGWAAQAIDGDAPTEDWGIIEATKRRMLERRGKAQPVGG